MVFVLCKVYLKLLCVVVSRQQKRGVIYLVLSVFIEPVTTINKANPIWYLVQAIFLSIALSLSVFPARISGNGRLSVKVTVFVWLVCEENCLMAAVFFKV